MTEQGNGKSSNDAQTGLIVFGLLALVGGVIGAFIARDAADKAAFGDELYNSMIGLGVTDVAPDLTGMWIAVVVAVLGAVMLIAAAVLACVRSR